MPVASGELVAGRFRLEHELGRGGMGSVWRAHQVALDTPCAVKFIEGEGAALDEHRARFEREAKAAAQLRSPNVVQILDHGVWEDRPYIAMELLEGEDLGRRLERLGKLANAETALVIAQVARALTKAHAAGIVHRDLKPDNVFLVQDDDREVAKVLDFGIAKTTTQLPALTKTRTGALLGTPYYMSPEQAKGTAAIDARSDLWSLAVIAFECVTGKRPFESEALGDLFSKIMHDPVPIPSTVAPEVPPAFDRWWARASARPVDERFQSARELADALADALGVDGAGRRSRGPSGDDAASVAAVSATTPRLTPSAAKQDALAVTEAAPPSPAGHGSAPTFGGQARASEEPRSRSLRGVAVAVGLTVTLGAALFVARGLRSGPDATPGSPEPPTSAPPPATDHPTPPRPSVTVELGPEASPPPPSPAPPTSPSTSASTSARPRGVVLRPSQTATPAPTAATPAPTPAPAPAATPAKPVPTGPRID
jgi:serine/threonine-protein kinase